VTTIDVQLRTEWINGVGYRYDVLLDGEVIVHASRDPEFDAARVLQARALRGRFRTIDFRTGRPRMELDIAKAAGLCTIERADKGGPRVVPYRPLSAEARSLLRGQPLHRGGVSRDRVASGAAPANEAVRGEGAVRSGLSSCDELVPRNMSYEDA
jgi:hypothetical protein